jgi:ATP-dependent metalloprotease
LKKATSVAFQVAGLWGMSQKLGPVAYLQEYKDLSSETKAMVEMEVQRILNRAQDEAMKLLTERRTELDLLAQALVRYETLDKEEVQKVIRGESLPNRIALPPDAPMVLVLPESTGLPPITGPSGSDPPPPGPPPPVPPPAPPAPSATP